MTSIGFGAVYFVKKIKDFYRNFLSASLSEQKAVPEELENISGEKIR